RYRSSQASHAPVVTLGARLSPKTVSKNVATTAAPFQPGSERSPSTMMPERPSARTASEARFIRTERGGVWGVRGKGHPPELRAKRDSLARKEGGPGGAGTRRP